MNYRQQADALLNGSGSHDEGQSLTHDRALRRTPDVLSAVLVLRRDLFFPTGSQDFKQHLAALAAGETPLATSRGPLSHYAIGATFIAWIALVRMPYGAHCSRLSSLPG